jgi:hypothetical protein
LRGVLKPYRMNIKHMALRGNTFELRMILNLKPYILEEIIVLSSGFKKNLDDLLAEES